MARTSKTAKKTATVKKQGEDQSVSESSLHKPLVTVVKRKNKMSSSALSNIDSAKHRRCQTFTGAALRELAETIKSDQLTDLPELETEDVVLVNLAATA